MATDLRAIIHDRQLSTGRPRVQTHVHRLTDLIDLAVRDVLIT